MMMKKMLIVMFLVGVVSCMPLEDNSAKKSILETVFEALGSNNGADIHINFVHVLQPGSSARVDMNPIANAVAKAADANKDGKLSIKEFEKITEDALNAIFNMHDLDNDGSISEEEILSGGFTIEGIIEIINIIFRVADVNRDGFISTADYIKQDSRLDSNKDGRISLLEYQEFGDGQLPQFLEFLVKAIKLLDRDLDGQVSLEDVDRFVRAGCSIMDTDKSGHIDIDEQISSLIQHGLTEEFASTLKKQFKNSQNAFKSITRYIVNEIDDDVDGQVDRNEFVAVLRKPFPGPEMLAKLVESLANQRPSMEDSRSGELEAAPFISVLDSFLDNPKFSE